MEIRWQRVYARLFEMIDSDGETYFSGPRFIRKVQETDPYFPDYSQYIEERRNTGKSTTRRVYFRDILHSFEVPTRLRILKSILGEVRPASPDKVSALFDELSGGVPSVPQARIEPEVWNADRLNNYLQEMDSRVASGNYDGAVTIAYTCLEGFLKAFVRKRIPEQSGDRDLILLSRGVQRYLQEAIQQYPREALTMLNHIAHTADRARNEFSESHFEGEAGRWLATFLRDLVNAYIRLLLHFI